MKEGQVREEKVRKRVEATEEGWRRLKRDGGGRGVMQQVKEGAD